MKKLLIGLITLNSISAFACPNISGEYTLCKSLGGMFADISQYVVQQSEESGITTFLLSGEEEDEAFEEKLISDGKTYGEEYVVSGAELDATTTTSTSCTDTQVITTSVTELGGASSNYTITRKFEKKAGVLVIHASGRLFNLPVNEVTVCK